MVAPVQSGIGLVELLKEWQVVPVADDRWVEALAIDPTGNLPGVVIRFLEADGEGQYRLDFTSLARLEETIQRLGRAPLPPYIQRKPDSDPLPLPGCSWMR